jgi:hypothetical protein
MWSLELEDEPWMMQERLMAKQRQKEREDRKRRKMRMNELAAKKALTALGGAGATGRGGADAMDTSEAGPSSMGGGTAFATPADTPAQSPAPGQDGDVKPTTTKPKPKTAEEKAAAKAQREAAKKAKEEAAAAAAASGIAPSGAGGKKKAKEPDIREANRSMGTHLAGVGKKRNFAWMPTAEGAGLGGTLNAKFSLGGKKRKFGMGAGDDNGSGTEGKGGVVAPWKSGKIGLGKLGGAGGDKNEQDGGRPSAPATGSTGPTSALDYMTDGTRFAFPDIPDQITHIDVKATLERYIARGGPSKQIYLRRWEELLLVMAKDDQERAKKQSTEVTAIFRIPPCHPGDEKAYQAKQQKEEEDRTAPVGGGAGAGAGTSTMAPGSGAGSTFSSTATPQVGLQNRPRV